MLHDNGIDTYFDEKDDCLKETQGDDRQVATCIEKDLDRTTALLSILTNDTFPSDWVPYEIGSARGRKRPIVAPYGVEPWPLIAHFIHQELEIKSLPAYLRLGRRLSSKEDLVSWAKQLKKHDPVRLW